MFPVYFYRFIKDENSTRRPTEHYDFAHCEFKDSQNITTPTLKIDVSLFNDKTPYRFLHYNYCYLPSTKRFYFVKNWRQVFNLWEADLEVDVLASFRELIGQSIQYVTRCSHIDGKANYIMDIMYPVKGVPSIEKKKFNSSLMTCYSPNFETGGYVIGVVSDTANSKTKGSVSYYALNHENMRKLVSALFADTEWANNSAMEISSELFQSLFNPLQYIVSCWWFPFNTIAYSTHTTTGTFKIGWWSVSGVSVFPLTSFFAEETDNVTLPLHPDTKDHPELRFLCGYPYSTYTLYYPSFGTIAIPDHFVTVASARQEIVDGQLLDFVNDVTFKIKLTVDLTTGQSELRIDDTFMGASVCGSPVQLSQESINYLGTAQGVINSVGGFVGGLLKGDFGSAISTAVNGVASALESITPDVVSSGTGGSFISARSENSPYIKAIFKRFDYNLMTYERLGHSHCKIEQIEAVPGYIEVSKPSFDYLDIDASPGDGSKTPLYSEIEQIKKMMINGFRYEVET